MKPCLLMLALALLAPPASLAQPAEHEMLLNFLTRFLDSAARNEAEAHARFWSDDLVYTSANGERFSKSEIVANVREEGPRPISRDTPIYSAEDLRVRTYGDAAVMNFILVESLDVGETEIGRYRNSCTLVKRDGRWEAVNWQSTEIE